MDLLSELEGMGINTGEALRRFSNNSALYIRMLGKLPAAIVDLQVLPFIENGEIDTATTNAHTLKGLTGNLSLSPLYAAYTQITNDLRAGEADKAKSELEKILPLQSDIIACIEKYK
ncbi:MAG: Hpt domain-containing protein [[Eubacterium] siraeum]|nr:Hpt domain-containing protein [[Eubacterium] siraeum]